MKKIILASIIVLFALAQTVVKKAKYPAALRCGVDPICCNGPLYFAHGSGETGFRFDQVFSGEVRYIYFNGDGSYHSGGGHYDSRKGC